MEWQNGTGVQQKNEPVEEKDLRRTKRKKTRRTEEERGLARPKEMEGLDM